MLIKSSFYIYAFVANYLIIIKNESSGEANHQPCLSQIPEKGGNRNRSDLNGLVVVRRYYISYSNIIASHFIKFIFFIVRI